MLREYRPARDHGSSGVREERDDLDRPPPFGKVKPVTKAMTFNGNNGNNVNNLNGANGINGGSCNVVAETHLPEVGSPLFCTLRLHLETCLWTQSSRFSPNLKDFRDRFTKMLAVGDENEDPMMASSGVFLAPEAPHGVTGNNRMAAPLNQVSNHSSVSSGFGSAGGGAVSPNSSYVTAPNSDDSGKIKVLVL